MDKHPHSCDEFSIQKKQIWSKLQPKLRRVQLWPNRDQNGYTLFGVIGGYEVAEVGGIEPHTRVVAQGLTLYCDQIVTVFYSDV